MKNKQTSEQQARRLFELYEQKMYAIACAILHDEGYAEDAVMDAFERIIRRNLNLDPHSDDMKRVVLASVKRASIDAYRKQRRERERLAFPGEEALERAAGSTEDEGFETLHANNDGKGATANARQRSCPGTSSDVFDASQYPALLNDLPDHYRDVLVARVVEERSVAETANRLGISQANVRKRHERALKALRAKMGAHHAI